MIDDNKERPEAAAETAPEPGQANGDAAKLNDAGTSDEAPEAPEAPRDAAPEGQDLEPGELEEAAEEAPPPSPEEEIAQLKDQLLRAMAETENVRRRGQKDLADTRKYAITEFARDLLAIGDNLDRALTSARAEEGSANPGDLGGLLEGVELTERQFQQILEKFGVKKIDAEGQKLDPHLHQAMMQVEHGEAEPGTIVQVVQTGYTLQDRLLRPAMVGVAKAPASAAADPGTDPDRNPDSGADPGQHVDTEA